MQVDFDTFGAIIAFLTSAAGVGGLLALLEDADLKGLQTSLGSLVSNDRSDYDLIKKKTRNLGWRLLTGIFILHLVNLVVYIALLLVLIIRPEGVPTALWIADPAIPFTLLETILYAAWWIISMLVYLFRCILPTISSISLYARALKWLRKHPVAHE